MYDITHESKLDAAITRGYDPHEPPNPAEDDRVRTEIADALAQGRDLRAEFVDIVHAHRAATDRRRTLDRVHTVRAHRAAVRRDGEVAAQVERDQEWWS